MKPLAAVLASTLLLGGCSYNGIMGLEFEITPELVSVRPVTDVASESPRCLPWRARKNWC